jgi:pseudouridine-5'-phosphate glycosidase
MQAIPIWLEVQPAVAAAVRDGRPVVALESSLIAHGLPWPENLTTARLAEQAVCDQGAVPATIAVWQGRPTIGLSDSALEEMARGTLPVLKLSRRDLPAAIISGQAGATTVAATMYLAHCAGIRVFATGGIGGVHRGDPADVSADLFELSRTPVAVVCAGAKSILDIPRTLEALESLSVPVIGYCTDEFPGFYLRSSGQPVPLRLDTADQVAAHLAAHWRLGGAGVVLAQPVPREDAIGPEMFQVALEQAEAQAAVQGVRAANLTPFLLGKLAELTKGQTLLANIALVENNARLAARIAMQLTKISTA